MTALALPMVLLLLAASRTHCQLLWGHGDEESDLEAQAMRPPALCNGTEPAECPNSQPNQPLLTAIVTFFSLLLLAMICSMALPPAAQNSLFRFVVCACRRKRGRFSYVDVGLYKTRHSMYRKEVYVRHVWGNNRGKRKGSNGSHLAATAAGRRLSLAPGGGRLSIVENGSARRLSRPLLSPLPPPTVAVVSLVADEAQDRTPASTAMVFNAANLPPCGSVYCCFRSDPNLWRTAHPALTLTPPSPKAIPSGSEISTEEATCSA